MLPLRRAAFNRKGGNPPCVEDRSAENPVVRDLKLQLESINANGATAAPIATTISNLFHFRIHSVVPLRERHGDRAGRDPDFNYLIYNVAENLNETSVRPPSIVTFASATASLVPRLSVLWPRSGSVQSASCSSRN